MDQQLPMSETSTSGSQRVKIRLDASRIRCFPRNSPRTGILFNRFINDIVDEVESEIRLFADDCVCYRPIANVQDCEQLQKDIDHPTSWAKKWFMRFEPSKCKIMHITRKTTHKITYQYTIWSKRVWTQSSTRNISE